MVTGVALGRSQVRSKYGVTVVGIERHGEDFTYATAETVVQKGDVIIVPGRTHAVETFAEPSAAPSCCTSPGTSPPRSSSGSWW